MPCPAEFCPVPSDRTSTDSVGTCSNVQPNLILKRERWQLHFAVGFLLKFTKTILLVPVYFPQAEDSHSEKVSGSVVSRREMMWQIFIKLHAIVWPIKKNL